MSDFNQAIGHVLQHEGGLVANPHDPGGITNFGISLRFLQTVNPAAKPDDIQNLTRDQAVELYRKAFWCYDGIADQTLANKIFDMAVNMGPGAAHVLALRSATNVKGLKNAPDWNSSALDLLNSCDTVLLLQELRVQSAVYYGRIVARKPDSEIFLLGWMRRALD